MARGARFAVLGAALVVAAASGGGAPAVPTPSQARATIAALAQKGVPRWRAWLCKPGIRRDYCDVNQASTLIFSDGRRLLVNAVTPPIRPVDCFYVYPTISLQRRGNADLRIEDVEKAQAVIQAGSFEQVCRVFAPVYRQTTSYSGIYGGDPELAYDDVLAAWRDYLAHDNGGRGVVLIGHSQGAFVLKKLIQRELDRSPTERARLVSAILLGGAVTVADGSDVGGDFRHVPVCRSKSQTGCVVAYSSWDRTPPKDADYEWVRGGNRHVVCVNPAAPAGGTAPITPLFPYFAAQGIVGAPVQPAVDTLWIGLPGLYAARCVQQGRRAWLLVKPVGTRGETRPLIRDTLGPQQGLHAADVSIALLDLVALVHFEAEAWVAHH